MKSKTSYLIMVISEPGKAIGGIPSDVSILGCEIQVYFLIGNQGQVGDRNYTHGRISLRPAESIELF